MAPLSEPNSNIERFQEKPLKANMEMSEKELSVPISDRWRPIFVDPSFGGECMPLPTKETKSITRLQRNPEPVFDTVPADVNSVLSSPSPEPAGSPVKAAQYLKRAQTADSQDSGLSDGSALSDVTDAKPAKEAERGPSKESNGSSVGFGSSATASKQPTPEPQSSVRSQSKETAASGFSDISEPKQVPPRKVSKESQESGFSDVSAASKREVVLRPTQEEDQEDEKDSDLLSNPFATDSEEEQQATLAASDGLGVNIVPVARKSI